MPMHVCIYQMSNVTYSSLANLDRVRDQGFGTGTWTECISGDSLVGVAGSVHDIL